jgi:integrase
MSRRRYQRPTIYLWTGKTEKFWKVEWKQYIVGRSKPKHRAMTWPCSRFTKSQAQEAADKLIRGETEGPARPDGSVTVREFCEQVFFPVRKKRVAPNTQQTYETAWRTHVEPVIGGLKLQAVRKHAVDTVLDRIADAGRSKQTVRMALVIMRELFAEAVEDGRIGENPARKATLPNCKEGKETQALTVEQVVRLFERTSGRDYMMWRVMVMCGLRIGECLALRKTDVLPEGLVVDESALKGKPAPTKNRKRRLVPIGATLRSELADWARTVEGDLLFPGRNGVMLNRKGEEVTPMLSRARKGLGIPDLTFRQCRTTLATQYRGDPRDLQEALGHADLKLTMNIYRKPILERQQAAMDELEARLAGKVVPIKKLKGA